MWTLAFKIGLVKVYYDVSKLDPPNRKVFFFSGWTITLHSTGSIHKASVTFIALHCVTIVVCKFKQTNFTADTLYRPELHEHMTKTQQQQQLQEQGFKLKRTPKHLEQKWGNNTYPELWLSRALLRVKSTYRRTFWHGEDRGWCIHRTVSFVHVERVNSS